MSEHVRGHAGDEGAAVVAAVALVAVLVSVLLGIAMVVDVLAARQRAADVADLAALAAVATPLPSEPLACDAARWVAQGHAARLRSCALVEGDVVVAVSVPVRGPASARLAALLGGVPDPTVVARAGRR